MDKLASFTDLAVFSKYSIAVLLSVELYRNEYLKALWWNTVEGAD